MRDETRMKLSMWAKANPRGFIANRPPKRQRFCPVCGGPKPAEKRFNRTCGRRECISSRLRSNGGYRERAGRGIKGWFRGIFCSSLWELAFVAFHTDNGNRIKRNRQWWEYQLNGKTHRFYPDFWVNDRLFEIKGRKTSDHATAVDNAKEEAVPGIMFLFKDGLEPMFQHAREKYGLEGKALAKLYENKPRFRNCLECSTKIVDDGRRRFCSTKCGTIHSRRNKFWSNTGRPKVLHPERLCFCCGVTTTNKRFCSLSCAGKITRNRRKARNPNLSGACAPGSRRSSSHRPRRPDRCLRTRSPSRHRGCTP